MDGTKEMVSSWCNRTDAHMNSRRLWPHARGMRRFELHGILSLRGGSRHELPLQRKKKWDWSLDKRSAAGIESTWMIGNWSVCLGNERKKVKPGCRGRRAGLTVIRERCRKMLTFMLAWCLFPSFLLCVLQMFRHDYKVVVFTFYIGSHLTWKYMQLTLFIGVWWIIASYQWPETLCHFQRRDVLPLQRFVPSFLS